MIINHNMNAMNAHRQMGINTTNNGKSIEKLSSGLRINRAGDDAAGLAISEKMRGQIRGLDQASRNAQDSISLIQTAEGALNETHSILQRMRELAVQSASDTNTTVDRGSLQKEIDQLTKEIDRIAETTEFNTKKLLNGGAGLDVTVKSETVAAGVNADWISISGGTADTKVGEVNISSATAAGAATYTTATVTDTASAARTISINGTTINYTSGASATATATNLAAAINAVSDQTGVTAAVAGAGSDTVKFTSSGVGTATKMDISETTLCAADIASTTYGTDASIVADTGTGTATAIAATDMVAKGNVITVIGGNFKGMELTLHSNVMNATTATDNDSNFVINANGTLNMQIGANEGQTMNIAISDMRAAALGVQTIDVTTSTTASKSITTINNAIETVSSERSKLGAYQNRLEHTINNLNTSSENLQSSESRIRDVDMAKEMMTYSKTNILTQAAQAMLAQANQQPQNVLQLLR